MNLYISFPEALHKIGKRETNEDYIYPTQSEVSNASRLFMVCDGIGGPGKGEVASRIVANRVADYLNNTPDDSDISQLDLSQALISAEEALSAHINAHRDSIGMGSTLALLHVGKSKTTFAWVGNSKIYYYSDKKNELIPVNPPLPDTPTANIHGKEQSAQVSIKQYSNDSFDVGDYFMLCTQGIFERVDEGVMHTLFKSGQTPANLIQELARITEGNTENNYSCYLLQVLRVDKASSKPGPSAKDAAITSGAASEKTKKKAAQPKEHEDGDTVVSLMPFLYLVLGILVLVGAYYGYQYFFADKTPLENPRYLTYKEKAAQSLSAEQYDQAILYYDSAYQAAENAIQKNEAARLKGGAIATRKENMLPAADYLELAQAAMEAKDYHRAILNYRNAIEVNAEQNTNNVEIPYESVAKAYIYSADALYEQENELKNYQEILNRYDSAFAIYESPEFNEPNQAYYTRALQRAEEARSYLRGEMPELISERGLPASTRSLGNTPSNAPKSIATGDRESGASDLGNLQVDANATSRSIPKATATRTSAPSASSASATSTRTASTKTSLKAYGSPEQKAKLQVGLDAFKAAKQVSNAVAKEAAYQKSIDNLEAAGTALDGEGSYVLAYMYHRGSAGEADAKKALTYAKRSALLGWPSGHYLYAHMLLLRKNKTDSLNAKKSLRIAAQKGHEAAKRRLTLLN